MKPIASAVALAVSGLMNNAYAQQVAAPAAELETIVVTANKHIEKLESVAGSISVVNEAVIQRNNIREVEDLVALTPALSISTGTTSANNAIILRGVGTQTTSIGVEGDVIVIVDDIPLANQFQAFKDLSDVSRIEVLKGPQSTLFGKAAIAGAVSVVTKPISGPLVSRGTLLYTNDGEWRIGASFGGKVTDTIGVRVAANKTRFAGNLNNLTTGRKLNGSEGNSLIAKLSWKASSNLDVSLTPYYDKSANSRGNNAIDGFVITNTTTKVSQQAGLAGSNTLGAGGTSLPVFLIGQGIGTTAANAPATFPATATSLNAMPASTALAGITPTKWNKDVRRDFPGGVESTDRGAGLKVLYSLPKGGSLMSISSFDKYLATDTFDRDGGDQPVFVVATAATGPVTKNSILTFLVGVDNSQTGTYDIRSKTQEIRFVSPGEGTFRYLAGLWFAKDETYRFLRIGQCQAPSACVSGSESGPRLYAADIYHVSKAVFGQATWDFAPTYSVLVGFRNNLETSGYHFSRSYFTNQTAQNFVPDAGNVFAVQGDADRSYSGKLSLQKQFNKEWMAYAMAATGHKGVAYDLLSGLSATSSAPVQEEDAQTMELGFKGNLFKNRMSINGALYNTEFFNYQQSATVALGAGLGTTTKLSSLPRVRTRGMEVDMNALVTPDFNLSVSLAYTESTIQQWDTAACFLDPTNTGANGSVVGSNTDCFKKTINGVASNVQNLAGKPMFNAPKIRAVIGGVYDVRAASLPFNGFINANVKYQSDISANILQNTTANYPAYTIVDLGFGITEKKSLYKLSFLVNNLFNKQYTNNGFGQTPGYRGAANAPATVVLTSWKPVRDTWRYATLRLDVKY